MYDFLTGLTRTVDLGSSDVSLVGGHGGGDDGLMEAFTTAVGWPAGSAAALIPAGPSSSGTGCAASPTSHAAASAPARQGSSRGSAAEVDNNAVRAWAAENGYEVSPRGRIKGEIIEAHRAAMG